MPLYLKQSKSENATAIRLQISLNGSVHHYATGETILPGAWDRDKQKCRTGNRYPMGENTNLRLAKVVNAEGLVRSRFKTDGVRPTWGQFKAALDKQLDRNAPPTESFWDYVDQRLLVLARDKKGRLFINHQQTYRVLREFETTGTFNFESFDLKFFERFVHWCRTKKRLKNNTIGKHVKTLKSWLNGATIEGLNKSLWFKTYKVFRERTDEIFLSHEDIGKLMDLSLSGAECTVRDVFVFACYTGLRYVDYRQVKESAIHGQNLRLHQSKTGEPVVIPLRGECLEILARYEGSLPKPPPNQVMNRYLKFIAVEAGLEATKAARVKTHTARRSFATNLYLENFPVHDIMRITGHKSERSFMLYIRTTNMDAANRLREHWGL